MGALEDGVWKTEDGVWETEEKKIWRGRKRRVKVDGGKVRRYINIGGEKWR